jgi:hypothetical protein
MPVSISEVASAGTLAGTGTIHSGTITDNIVRVGLNYQFRRSDYGYSHAGRGLVE